MDFRRKSEKEEKWFETFETVSGLLRKTKIRHSFIKTLFDPFKWGDIDVLIQGFSEIQEASRLLKSEGFAEKNAGMISPPNKMVFEKEGCPPVEIYPKVAWKRLLVANEDEILSRSSLANMGGIKACIPEPEDEFYLIATHAISHMRVTEVEIMNALRLAKNRDFSLERVKDLSFKFGTQVETYFFLKTMMETGSVERILNSFDFRAKCFIDAWFERKRIRFPIAVPKVFGRIFPIFYHVPAMLSTGGRKCYTQHDFKLNVTSYASASIFP